MVRLSSEMDDVNPWLLHLAEPVWLWVLLICPALCWSAMRSAVSAPLWQRILMSVLRCLLMACLCVGLAEPSLQRESTARCSVLLIDVSPSLSSEAIENAVAWAHRYEQRVSKSDSVHYVQFDEAPHLVNDPAHITQPPRSLQSASDYGRALRFSAGLCHTEPERQVVLFGDGLDTHRGLIPAAERLRELGYRIDVVPSRVAPLTDVAVRRLTPPNQIEMGRPFRVGVELTATRESTIRLQFELDGAPNSRDPGRSLDLPSGNSHIDFESQINHAGPATLRVYVTAASDSIAENNRVSATVDVEGPPRVLYVDGLRTTNAPIVAALTAQRFSVESMPPERLPAVHENLRPYAAVILSNVRRDQLGASAEQSIEHYVRGYSGVLLFAGDSTSFASGGWSGSRLERLLPVRFMLPERQPVADLALT
ncbi:MAG TPA: vWA domain-containing protein, partial [Polyangiaceae bacterium]